MNLPKLATKLLIFILIPLALSACSLLPKRDQEVVNLEYWGLWEAQSTIETIIGDYKKVKPNVNITYKKRIPQQYRESLETQIPSGTGPDIFRFHNTWLPMLKEELDPVPANVLTQQNLKANYYPVVLTDLVLGGKLYGIPLQYDGIALYYNEDIFKAAGVTKPPSTWTEFAQTATKLTVKDPTGNIKTAGAAIGTAGNVDHFSDILGLMILQNGGSPKSPTQKATVDAVDYYTSFAKGANRVWDESLPKSSTAFVGNSAAMYFGPSWRAIEFKNANPLLKFKVAPVPQLEGDKVSWASYWAEGVSAKSANKQEAWEFLKYLQTDEVLTKLYTEAAKSPGRFFGEPYPKISLAQKLATDPIIGAYIADAPFARSFSMASRTFDNGLNDQIIKAYEDAVNQTLSQTSSAKALETTAKNVNTILTRFNSSQ